MAAPTIDCGSPPDGVVGVPYEHTLPNTHSGSVFTVSISGGALPDGLTMDPAGEITGTPTAQGAFDFTATIVTPTGAPGAGSTTVDLPDSGLGWDFRQSPNAPIPDASGAFEYAGNQYLFLFQGSEFGIGDLRIHVHKSTDAGVTWNDVADVGIPAGGVDSAVITHTVCVDGAVAYLMAVALDGPSSLVDPAGPLLLFTYDLAGDTFSAGSTPAGAPTVHKFWTGPTGIQPRSGIGLHLLRRGPGDMLLLYTDREGISSNYYARVSVATFDGSSFGSTAMLPGQAGITDFFLEKCAAVDGSGILHTIIIRSNTHSFKYAAMNASGTFGASQEIEANVFYVTETSNMLVFAGATETVAFLAVRNRSSSNPDGDLTIYHAPAGTLTPTWSSSTVLSTAHVVLDARFAPDFPMALGVVDTTLHAFWTQSGSPADGYSISQGMGVIRHSTATVLNLTAWSAEDTFLGPIPDPDNLWAACQVRAWQGPTIGLGVTANFAGFSVPDGRPIEWSQAGSVGGPGLETDSVDCTITITIAAPSIGLGCASPPDGVVGVEYRHTFPVSGGIPPFTFAIISGILPPGLTLDSLAGEVSGTPTVAGDFEFVIQVSDDFGSTVGTCDIVITVTHLPAPDITCDSPPAGVVAVAYSHTFPVTDIPEGATVSYAITGGALPPGLTLNAATGEVTGTPTTEGHYTFTITVTVTLPAGAIGGAFDPWALMVPGAAQIVAPNYLPGG